MGMRGKFVAVLAFAVGFFLAIYLLEEKDRLFMPRPGNEPVSAPAKSSSHIPKRQSVAASPVSAGHGEDSRTGDPPLSLQEIERIRSQVRVSFAGLYTGEKAFFAEYGRYTTDLALTGWIPPQTRMNFKLGFLSAYEPEKFLERESPRAMDSDSFAHERDPEMRERFEYSRGNAAINLQEYQTYCKEGCTANAKRFELIGVIDFGNGHREVWGINDRKELKQLSGK
jgi:hypothetical protein